MNSLLSLPGWVKFQSHCPWNRNNFIGTKFRVIFSTDVILYFRDFFVLTCCFPMLSEKILVGQMKGKMFYWYFSTILAIAWRKTSDLTRLKPTIDQVHTILCTHRLGHFQDRFQKVYRLSHFQDSKAWPRSQKLRSRSRSWSNLRSRSRSRSTFEKRSKLYRLSHFPDRWSYFRIRKRF